MKYLKTTSIKKKKNFFYLFDKNCVNVKFDLLSKKIELMSENKKTELILNYLHYKGFITVKNNFLYFRNNKSIIKIVKRITSLVKGFLKGFCIILEVIGLGFSVTSNNKELRFNIGYNHSIFYTIPKNIKICSKRKFLFLYSYCFFILKNVVTDIKNFRKLNAYKLKGIKEKNELYNKKNWKKKIG